MSDITFKIGGSDYTSFLLSRPRMTERKSIDQKFVIGDMSFVLSNMNGEFSPGNDDYLFAGGEIYGKSVELLYRNVRMWLGIAENPTEDEDRRQASLKARNNLSILKLEPIDRTSTGVNPAIEALAVIQDAGISSSLIDLDSFEKSAALLDDGPVLIDLNLGIAKKKKIAFALEQLAKAACADLYTVRGKIVFKVWESAAVVSNISLGHGDLHSIKRDAKEPRYIINDYLVNYNGDGGTPTRDSDNNNIGSASRINFSTRAIELDNGDDQPVEYTTKAAGVFVGEKYIERYQSPKDFMKFSFPIGIETDFSLNRALYLTYSRFGYSEKAFEPLKIGYDFGRGFYAVDAIEI